MLHRPNFHRGFTLVELLVVVAIIVVLLALLTTALSAAIYQAELATCAAGQRSIATSTLTYAMGHRRSYPHRPGALEAEYWMPSLIYDPGLFSTSSAGGIAFDDRFALRQFLSVNASLNDPLAAAVDFENSDAVLLVGYHLWFGFRYYGQRGMLRMGDRFTYAQPADPSIVHRFEFLVTDRDVIDDTVPYVIGNHPDADGVMFNEVKQDETVQNDIWQKLFTTSRWINYNNAQRGLIDMNFTRQDGSVERMSRVERHDERLIPLSEFTREHYPTSRTYLPEH